MANYVPENPGVCVKLIASGWGGYEDLTLIVPIKEDFVASAEQEISAPIADLFKEIKKLVVDSSGALFGGTGTAIASGGLAIQDLFGTRLGGREFYMKAWKGAAASSITLNLEFPWGWMGSWDAKAECHDPAMLIMGRTVPWETEGGSLLNSPMPSPIEVYTQYGANVIANALADVANVATGALITGASDVVANDLTKYTKGKNITTTKNAGVVKLGKTWNIEYGFYTDGNNFVSILDLGSHIIKSSTISQSPQFQKVGDKFYSISSKIIINAQSQSLYTDKMFEKGT